MNIKYYLSNGKNECTIRACFIINRSNQFKINIPFKIEPKYWDRKNQVAKKNMHGYEVFNERLLFYRLDLLKQIRLMNMSGMTDWKKLKLGIKQHIKTGNFSLNKSAPLTNGIIHFINSKTNEYKSGTIRKYRVLITLIEDFETKYNLKITTENIDYTTVENFRQYVLFDRNNRNDTAYKTLASLKCVIKWLIKNGYKIDPESTKVKQKIKAKYDIVTLTEVEIMKIKSVKLPLFKQKIRDCFLFQIYTGQRYSDMQQLSPDQVNNNMWIFRSVKTEKLMHIPFIGWTAEAEVIAKKYNYRFPQYSSQYFNRALKLICKNAGLNTQVKLTRYQGVKEIIIDKPKYELVSSHTARRTSVSLLLAKGVPPTVVMRLSGHSDIKTMMKYERTITELLEKSLMQISGL